MKSRAAAFAASIRVGFKSSAAILPETLIKPYVRGIYPNPIDRHLLNHVWIDHQWKEGTGNREQGTGRRREGKGA